MKIPAIRCKPGLQEKVLSGKFGRLRRVETGNYIDPHAIDGATGGAQGGEPFVTGRLSRAAVEKFPDDFPDSYEGLGTAWRCQGARDGMER